MKFATLLLFATLSTSAFAMFPVGHYTGQCDQTSSMQNFKDGKTVGDPYVSPGYTLTDLTVTKNGSVETYVYKTKMFFKDGPPAGFEDDFTQTVQMVEANVERRTDSDGSHADYRIEADDSMDLIASVEKNGDVIKPTGAYNDFVAADGDIWSAEFDTVGATPKSGSTFTGWAYAGSKTYCDLKPDAPVAPQSK